ncbi:TetR/AcrR family transcriptional regulator [Ferrimicrobium acidiphilum]|uniref:HTH-type transcriptional regulator EthR n=1 Tax=Ferrimicrobium acidiphilum DSM 19497 TaxID=1121877 RepID=A0A0D8FSX9_9ACTN|nr:TetR/AcrR family transcriptional regulator [Ferrimicrobium acidiphilum]KJE76383.1 HTH-type transcriptional regulator EthR [Ferrimicrobium acidiphilum DSM 19497]MCL5052569.1 TetR/AcrR family transcriptional regulator [Gammaproteobacteria bacterium]
MPPSPARTSRLSAADRREIIITAAIEQFALHGFDAASMDEIAAGASVTKPIIYRHFHSKRNLYLELLQEVGERLTSSIEVATATVEPPHDRLRAGVVAFFDFVQHHRSAYLLLFGGRGQRDDEFQHVVDDIQLRIAQLVASRVSGVEDETYRVFVSFALIGLTHGAARSYLLDIERHHSDRFRARLAAKRAAQTAELLWSGMRNLST